MLDASISVGPVNNLPYSGNSVSPVHPFMMNMGNFMQPMPVSPVYAAPVYKSNPVSNVDPRHPFGQSNVLYSPVHPSMSYTSYSPRDPRLFHQPPMMPFHPVGGHYSPDESFSQMRRKASRSQPAKVRRRSYTSASSDSDVAEEISARILGSSDDPRELKSIIKGTASRKLRKHKSAGDHGTLPPLIDEISAMFAAPSRRGRRHRSMEKTFQSRSVTPPVVPAMPEEAIIPAALDTDYFNEEHSEPEVITSSPIPKRNTQTRKSGQSRLEKSDDRKSSRPQRRRSSLERESSIPQRSDERKSSRRRNLLTTTRTVHTAIAVSSRNIPRRKGTRISQKDQLGDKVQTLWNPESLATGKRQRLPPLDWRKGEVYLRAPDGTVVGKEGFKNLVFDDSRGASVKKQRKVVRNSIGDESTAAEEVVAARDPPPRNALDYMTKDSDGIYCLGSHRLLHRSADRTWGDKMEDQGGFRVAPSIVTDDAFIAEIALEPGCSSGRDLEIVPADQGVYGRVLQAEASGVRIHINGVEERLNEEDEFFMDQGCKYLIENVSADRTAVLSLTAFSQIV